MKQFSIIIITVITILSYHQFLDNQFVLKPAHPKVGEVLSISYDTGVKDAVHKNARKITCEDINPA